MRLFVLALLLSVMAAAPSFAADTPPDGDTLAKQAIMIDYDTGAVLFEKNPDERMPTSSMSKVLTINVVFDAIKSGRLTMDMKLPVSEKAWRIQGSKMFVELGNQIDVSDLVKGVAIQSGNDATIVLAEGVAGTEESFAQMLNQKAKELGMNNSHFMNASGWPDPEHYSTARDLATLAVHTIRDYPDHYALYKEIDFTYHNIKQGNRNPLLYRGIGADGIKTGHTEDGGYGLMGSGVLNGRRVVMVLNGMSSMQERADESARILEWGLRAFENISLFKAGDTVDSIPVVMGMAAEVPITVESDVLVTVPVAVKNDMKVDVSYMSPLEAPVKKGQKVGMLKISAPRLGEQEIPLVAAQDVAALGLFAATVEKAKVIFAGGHAAQQ